jgi:hypothetical protein
MDIMASLALSELLSHDKEESVRRTIPRKSEAKRTRP